MEWVRGGMIGRGSFSTINLAIPKSSCTEAPPSMAVKSALVSQSSMLRTEKEILTHLTGCPQILRCFGEDTTVENGEKIYSVFIELASRGNLSELIKKSGRPMNESEVRRHTRSILRGLRYIHEKGYVHCDIKLQNILVFSSKDGETDVKIADFGLAKKAGQKKNSGLKGTPLYMSPESIVFGEQESGSDIWALGCVVAEMVSGKPAWRCRADTDVSALLYRIGFGEELPEIPGELSEEGKDFLRKCFERDPRRRWTADMLLNHPFVDDCSFRLGLSDKPSTSPRSAFDFPSWSSSQNSFFSSADSDSCASRVEEEIDHFDLSSFSSSAASRVSQLAMEQHPSWSSTNNWVTVRQFDSSVSL